MEAAWSRSCWARSNMSSTCPTMIGFVRRTSSSWVPAESSWAVSPTYCESWVSQAFPAASRASSQRWKASSDNVTQEFQTSIWAL